LKTKLQQLVGGGTLLACIIGTSSVASAAPTLYPREGNRLPSLVNATTATVLSDHLDQNTFYVAPPATSPARTSNAFFGSNVGFCEDMAKVRDTGTLLERRRQEILLDFFEEEGRIQELSRSIATLEAEAVLFAAKLPNQKQFDALYDELGLIEDEIAEREDALSECDFLDDACEAPLEAELSVLSGERRRVQSALRALTRSGGPAARDYERAKARVNAAKAEHKVLSDNIDDLTVRIGIYKTQLDSLYDKYARLEGGTVTVSFDSGWRNALDKLRRDNPNTNFTQLPTQDVLVHAHLVPDIGSPGYLDQLPAVLSLAVNGRSVSLASFEQTLGAVPETFAGTARMSLVGACPMRRPELFKFEAGENGLPLLGLSATYAYPAVMRTQLKVKYNLWKTYEFMKKVSTKGGFFRTRSSVSMSEDTDGETSTSFVWLDEGSIPEERKQAIEAQVRADLEADVARFMGIPVYDRGTGPVEPPAAGESGAVVVSEGLTKTCGAVNVWCAAGAFVLRGLQAIFGGSTAEARFKQKFNFDAERSYTSDAVQLRSGQLVWSSPN
jgi:hypothetical protein